MTTSPDVSTATATNSLAEPNPIRLEDYEVPAFYIDTVALRFDLRDGHTTVTASLDLRRNPTHPHPDADLILDGQQLELQRVAVDGTPLTPERYQVDPDHLTITGLPEAFSLQTEVRIEPEQNTALEGLYKSGSFYCTQCEAEGFRRITYYLDRPDVLATFTTTVVGDRVAHPVLLANGNPVERGDLDDGRHFVTWEDPHKKPCYLFALVAGDLEHIEDQFTTAEGRRVTLQIYTTPNNIDKCDHAMRSLQSSMRWDEATYGLSCDLDHYMIVVTDDFNMGAMENKGLNVFNSKYMLARPDTATDADYAAIEGVIAHEYFHNWTGNRVTCRDWFQLSLKEGLTVFRDQKFSGDMNSPAIQRIGDVRTLRTHQFPEDRGPMAHPIRPASVIEINNFYTVTVYKKGAEVVRMYQTLLGEAGFRKGMDLYFERFDGQAVTCDDFRQAMADANDRDLAQFANWYSQAGTPRVEVSGEYDAAAKRYTLHLSQSCPATAGLANDQPFHIPFAVGLLDPNGADIPLADAPDATPGTRVLELVEPEQSFVFEDVPAAPVPSLLRGFSAPVIVERQVDDSELALLMAHDSDSFCRWDAAQQLMLQCLQRLIADHQAGRPLVLPEHVLTAFAATLARRDDDPALCAELLVLPGESFLGDQMEVVDVMAVHEVREFARRQLARALGDELLATYRACRTGEPYQLSAAEVARRSLQSACLGYLMTLGDPEVHDLCRTQFDSADNMTEVVNALANLCHHEADGHREALGGFYAKWREDPLVVDKWLAIQATSPRPGALQAVQELMQHEAFTLKNPNKVRALIGAFCGQNRVNFHAADGTGYRFLVDQVLALNALNPQIAARLTGVLNHWKRFDDARQALMRTELERIVATPELSRDVFEIASKALA